MKKTRQYFFKFSFCALPVAALWLSGCASPAYRTTDAAAASTKRAAWEIQAENYYFDSAINSLDALITNPAADLKPQFEAYDHAVDRLYDSVASVEKAVRRMQKKDSEHFKEWDEQIAALNYGITHDASEARKKEMLNEAALVNAHYVETREVVLPVLAYFEDIRKMLGADLTSNGIDATKPLAQKAIANARKVQLALGKLASQIAKTDQDHDTQNAVNAVPDSVGGSELSDVAPPPQKRSTFVAMTSWIKSSVFRMKPESNHIENLEAP